MHSPAVVAAVSEEKNLSAGAEENAKYGNVSFCAEDDAAAAALVRSLVSMLPANSAGDRNYAASSDDINRPADIAAMGDGAPRAVLAQIADNGFYLEAGAQCAPEITTAFARFDGETVGVVGAEGVVSMAGIGKAAAFVSFCDTFGISLLTIVNAAGFEMTPCFERFGGMSKAASLAAAYATADTAMITLVTGKATGSACTSRSARAASAATWHLPGRRRKFPRSPRPPPWTCSALTRSKKRPIRSKSVPRWKRSLRRKPLRPTRPPNAAMSTRSSIRPKPDRRLFTLWVSCPPKTARLGKV